ncbi:MAG: hypothetical protein ACO3JG_16160 [Luteolibacter sp.]
MQPFAPGDRVVAINTDLSGPILAPQNTLHRPFSFPDGPLRRNQVYHIASVQPLADGTQGVFLTGMRVLHGGKNISWHHSRFRKVDSLKGHVPKKRRRKKPATATRRAAGAPA